MSYRLPDAPPAGRKAFIEADDIAKQSLITVDNGTISRISIPCVYGRPFTRQEKMAYDHAWWPNPDAPDRSNYGRIMVINSIDLVGEGYDTVVTNLADDAPIGLTMSGSINYDMVELLITTMCASAEDEDVDVRFAVYVTGTDDDDQQLRDLVTKGVLHIVAGLIG